MSNGNPKCGNFSCSGSSVFALGNKLSNDWGLFLEIDHSPVTIIIPLGEGILLAFTGRSDSVN
jgi:hypothetical protein